MTTIDPAAKVIVRRSATTWLGAGLVAAVVIMGAAGFFLVRDAIDDSDRLDCRISVTSARQEQEGQRDNGFIEAVLLNRTDPAAAQRKADEVFEVVRAINARLTYKAEVARKCGGV